MFMFGVNSKARRRLTHHPDGEVVVDDAVRYRVSSLLLIRRSHVDFPAVQHHLGAVLDVPQDLEETLALVTSEKQEADSKQEKTLYRHVQSFHCLKTKKR